jgi:hypothetical protein
MNDSCEQDSSPNSGEKTEETTEPVSDLKIFIDGDFNRDALVPEDSVIPISTKDPALWTVSTDQTTVCHVPGGAWTTNKVLSGIASAWQSFPPSSSHGNGDLGISIKSRIDIPVHDAYTGLFELDEIHEKIAETYHWRLKPFPKNDPVDTEEALRIASVVPMDNKVVPVPPSPRNSHTEEADLRIIADYNVEFRYQNKTDEATLRTENENASPLPARVLMLGSVLPRKGNRKIRPNGSNDVVDAGKTDDLFWTSLLYKGDGSDLDNKHEAGHLGSIVVVGIDMLRLKGADISYEQSWDRILEDFEREKHHSETLVHLAKFEHLIVRIGVTGAIYHSRDRIYRNGETLLSQEGRTVLIYDPNAPRIWYRAPDDQGNILASRSAMVGCVVARLARARKIGEMTGAAYQSADKQVREHIAHGIKDSICFVQELYREGFGKEPDHLVNFTKPKYYEEVYERTVLYAGFENLKKVEENAKEKGNQLATLAKRRLTASPPQPYRRLYIATVEPPFDESPSGWGIFRSSLRMGVPDGHPALEAKGWKRDLDYFAEQRRLWLAMKIVMHGHRSILNSPTVHDAFTKEMTELRKALDKTTGLPSNLSDHISGKSSQPQPEQDARNSVVASLLSESDWRWPRHLIENIDRDMAVYLLQFLAITYPYNLPVAEFGELTAIGQRDVETYTNIRNLISNHLRQGKVAKPSPKPLGIAVFGGPGSGKSFGVNAIAKELGIAKPLVFNVSQFNGKGDLDRAFLSVCDALAKRSANAPPPMVFFDEFDCSGPGEGNDYAWLSCFLEPLQDGTYQHPSGALSLADTIFIFGGGINGSFREFEHQAVKQAGENEIHRAKVRKLPDFISRLRGYIDVDSLNRRAPDERFGPFERVIPYAMRALALRGMLKKIGFVDRSGNALVDKDVVEALLTVSRFKHGKRSIASILQGVVRFKQQVTSASFTSEAQLDMHTCGSEFRERMRLPGSHWITDHLYIPSRVLPEPYGAAWPEWKPVTQWELLSDCDNFPDGKQTFDECVFRFLEKIFDPDSKVWLRETNILDAAEGLLHWLKSEPKPNGVMIDRRERKWYQPFHVGDEEVTKHAKKVVSDNVSHFHDRPSSLNDSTLEESESICIPLAMIEGAYPVEFRLWHESGKFILISNSVRLTHDVTYGKNKVNDQPQPEGLWRRDWSWEKTDKVRILRHILKNFYIAVHGEVAWKKFEAEQLRLKQKLVDQKTSDDQ